jgi:hypothetical protein
MPYRRAGPERLAGISGHGNLLETQEHQDRADTCCLALG